MATLTHDTRAFNYLRIVLIGGTGFVAIVIALLFFESSVWRLVPVVGGAAMLLLALVLAMRGGVRRDG